MLLEDKLVLYCVSFLASIIQKSNERMNKLIGKSESKLFIGMVMSSVQRVARAKSLVRVNDGAGLVRRI